MLAKLQSVIGATGVNGGKPEVLDEAHEHAANAALMRWFLQQNRRGEDEA